MHFMDYLIKYSLIIKLELNWPACRCQIFLRLYNDTYSQNMIRFSKSITVKNSHLAQNQSRWNTVTVQHRQF